MVATPRGQQVAGMACEAGPVIIPGDPDRDLRRAVGLAGIILVMVVASGFANVSRVPTTVGAIHAYGGLHGMPVWTAYTRCGAGQIVDGGFALHLDTAGDQPGSGRLRMADVACVLGVLQAPSSLFGAIGRDQRPVRWRVDAKTFSDLYVGLDRYTGSYQFTATWRYQRATGLDMAITVVSDLHLRPDHFWIPEILLLQLGGS
jgi:hypothetical protein